MGEMSLNFTLLSILMIFLTIIKTKELLLVVEVSRHGARTPGKIFNFTINPEDNFVGEKFLTRVGRR